MQKNRRWKGIGVISFLAAGLVAISGCLFLGFAGFHVPETLSVFANHDGTVSTIVSLVQAGKAQEAMAQLDALHSALISLRADLAGLRIEGTAGALSDPIDVPAGTYRAWFATKRFGIVQVYDMGGEKMGRSLFNVSLGQATDGTSAIFNAPGGRIMFEFSNISAPYTLELELIN